MSTSTTLAAVDFGQGVSDARRAVITFVPKLAEQELPQAKAQGEAYQRGREDATRPMTPTPRQAVDAPTRQMPAGTGGTPTPPPAGGATRGH
ncbi:hypothetical protein SUDANB95_02718 [Actinosynnema sp. ALI-1.44]